MGNASSKSSEPPLPVTLPIGVFPEYTKHQDQMALELEIWPNGGSANKDDLRTIVRDLDTKQQIFSISPLEMGANNKEIIQTLYSSSNVPLMTLTSNQSTRKDTEYICRLASSGEEVFRAKEGVSSGSSACVYMFRNHLGHREESSLRIKVRKSGKVSAWDLQIGDLQFYSGWKRGSNHLLTVKPGVDVALMAISTLCLHRIEQAASSRAMTSAQASSSAAAASGLMMQASVAASNAGTSGAP